MKAKNWRKTIRALKRYGDIIVNMMQTELQNNNKVATGNLINELDSYTELEDNKVFLYLNMPHYGRYVDSGRAAGRKMPPDKSIRGWVKDKGIKPRKKQSEDQMIFAIRKSISIRGIDPVPFLDIWANHVDDLEEMIDVAAVKDIKQVITEYVSEFNKNI